MISYISSASREARQKRQQLESRIRTLQEVFKNKTPGTEKELILLRAEYEKLAAARVASTMLRLSQTFYEQGEKSGKLLALQTKQLEARRTIASVINVNGDTIIDPIEINNKFLNYYDNLYKSCSEFDPQTQSIFMDKLSIPNIPQEFAEHLETDLTEEEVGIAKDSIKVGKTPGPDGIPTDLYKTFKTKLLKPITGNVFGSISNR